MSDERDTADPAMADTGAIDDAMADTGAIDDGMADTLAAGSADEVERYCPTCSRSYDLAVETCPADDTRLVVLAPATDPLIGQVIDGRFTIKGRLGAGGMGAVYRAWQASVGREVAIKVIETRLGRDRVAAKRFLREAKLASALSQPNTISILDFGRTGDGTLFLAMELVRGKTLGQWLRQDGCFAPERAVRVGVQLCDALEAAHGRSIIHRDLKPSNIIVLDDPPGRDLLKVLDFGLAKSLSGETQTTVTQSNALVGTPLYISPEAVSGGEEDARSDLYSLGVILYELLAGRPPFRAESVNMLLGMHAYDPPPPLPDGVPQPLAEVVLQLLEKDPAARPQSAAETRSALTVALDAARVPPAGIASTGARAADDPAQRPVHGKKRTGRILGVAAVALIVGGGALLAAQALDGPAGAVTHDGGPPRSGALAGDAASVPAPTVSPPVASPPVDARVDARPGVERPLDAAPPPRTAPARERRVRPRRRPRVDAPARTERPGNSVDTPDQSGQQGETEPDIDYRLPD